MTPISTGRRPRLPLALLSAALTLSTSAAQEGRRPVPVPDPAQPEAEPGALEAPARETVAGGPVRLVPLADLPDEVPLRVTPSSELATGLTVEGVRAERDPFTLGFAAGDYTPPGGELVDPRLRAQAAGAQALRPGAETYAFAMFSKRMTDGRLAQLEALGARVLGRHPRYALRLALPPAAIDAVAELDFIRWVGVAQPWQKLHPLLSQRLEGAAPTQELDVWINLFDSDLGEASTWEPLGQGSLLNAAEGEAQPQLVPLPQDQGPRRWQSNGWQQQALETQGVQVTEYVDSIQAFRATLTAEQVARVRDLDFVQFVELELTPQLQHEESQPMIGVDLTRPSNSGGTFGDAVIGEADTGIESSHFMLNHIFGWGWDLAGTGGPWDDPHGHGSHVAGTIFGGSWTGHEAQYGAAPGLGSAADLRIFNLKVFQDSGAWGGASLQNLFDRLHQDLNDGANVTPYPHVVNNSWGSQPFPFIGSEADARALDNEVYIYNQLWTFAAGNYGPGASTLSVQATAKNTFAVGNVYPYRSAAGGPDELRSSSSRGPCGDGRWKPNVVAPGVSIDSADSANPAGLTSKTGTSMASPHVVGLAAQLVDRYDFLQYRPATLAAVLMGTSLSKSTHTSASGTHLDNYGAGRVSAYRAIGGNANQALYFWGFTQPSSSHVELDFNVGSGATRVTVVMTYHELASSSGASEALVQDVDMYIDRFPFSSAGNSGEYSLQVSHTDNTEIRTINSPLPAAYRVKCYPTDTFSSFAPKVGVCVVVEYGDTTPTLALGMAADKAYALPGESVEVTATLASASTASTAMSPYLDANTGGMALASVRSNLADGSVSELVDNAYAGTEVMLGDMRHSQSRSVTWEGSWSSEGTKTFSASLASPNASASADSVQVVVDGTDPSQPPGLTSTDHVAGQRSCDLSMSMDWGASSDGLSGVAGYSYLWSHSPSSTPDGTVDTTATALTQTLSPSASPWYFHVRAIDQAGNRSTTAHAGPYYLGTATWSSYCSSNLNSAGQMATLSAVGSLCLAGGDLSLRTVGLPASKLGYYIFGENPDNVPFFGGSQGVLCVGAPLIRLNQYVVNSGTSGVVQVSPDLGNLPSGITFSHGSTWHFQLWYRDNNPGSTSNTSNGIRVIWD